MTKGFQSSAKDQINHNKKQGNEACEKKSNNKHEIA